VQFQELIKLQDNVVVIGGGNVAVDVALTALRCGRFQ
jgi:NADPH-dependent glutamate synthase beta subunit-like oxidoreductase